MKGSVSVLVLLVCALFAGLGQGGHGDRYAMQGDEQALLASGGSVESGFANIVPGLPASETSRPSRDGDDEVATDLSAFTLPQPLASSALAHSHRPPPATQPCALHPPVRGPPTA